MGCDITGTASEKVRMFDYLNQATLLGPTQERPTRTSQLLYSKAPTPSTSQCLLGAPTTTSEADSQGEVNVLKHGQVYGKLPGARIDPHNNGTIHTTE